MGQTAARQNDKIVATDIHIILVPTPPGAPVPTPLPHPFNGAIIDKVSQNVRIAGMAAATVGSVARNVPPHLPNGPGTFQTPPTNEGKILVGSATVRINGKAAARVGDKVQTCQDSMPNFTGQIISTNVSVRIGG